MDLYFRIAQLCEVRFADAHLILTGCEQKETESPFFIRRSDPCLTSIAAGESHRRTLQQGAGRIKCHASLCAGGRCLCTAEPESTALTTILRGDEANPVHSCRKLTPTLERKLLGNSSLVSTLGCAIWRLSKAE